MLLTKKIIEKIDRGSS